MGGLFDMYLAGLPLYFWIIFIGALVLIFKIAWDWYAWDTIKEVGPGYYDAVRKNIPQALKISKNNQMKLMPVQYSNQVFEWEDHDEIQKWQLTSLTATKQMGRVNTAILVDYHDWVEDFVMNESIKIAAQKWNDAHPDDQIHHFTKYAKYREEGKLQAVMPNGVEVPSFFYVSFVEQEQYLPRRRDCASLGGYIMEEAKEFQNPGENEKKNYGTYILGACVLIGIVIIIFSFIIGSNMMGGKVL